MDSAPVATGCESRLNTEADEAGSARPPPSQRWEDVVVDELVTLVTDEEGNVIQYEMRDNRSNMLGSKKKRTHDECDTDHQRRPDVLWLV